MYLKLMVLIQRNIPEYDNGYMYRYNENNKPTAEKILNLLAKDLKYLKIKAYPSTINSPCIHGGYKIAIFLEYARNYDYHFVRQNLDGSWSAKLGTEDLVVQSDNPFAYLNDNIYKVPTYYKHIKTLELVKPRVK